LLNNARARVLTGTSAEGKSKPFPKEQWAVLLVIGGVPPKRKTFEAEKGREAG